MAKPFRQYKDSKQVFFSVTEYSVPRRLLKKLFDQEKASLIEDLSLHPKDKRRLNKARKLEFDAFLSELQEGFNDAVLMNEVDPKLAESILDWADLQFDEWAS